MDFDNEEDSEDELLDTIIQLEEDADRDFVALQGFIGLQRQSRQPKFQFNRRDWFEDLAKLRHTNEFQSRYHMTEASFNAGLRSESVRLLMEDMLAIGYYYRSSRWCE